MKESRKMAKTQNCKSMSSCLALIQEKSELND